MEKKDSTTSFQIYTKAVKTSNVLEALANQAKAWECSIHELDFDVLEVQTFYADKHIIYNQNDLDYMIDRIGSSQRPKAISQEYKILIHKDTSQASKLNLLLASNKTITKVYAAIKKNTILHSQDFTRDTFRDIATKKLLLNHILIGVWSRSLEEAIDKIFAKLDHKESIQCKNDLKFLVCEGIDFIPPTPATLKIYFEQEPIDFDSPEQVNHSNRNFIKTVASGSLIAEYTHYKPGSYGRNCKGEVLGDLKNQINSSKPPVYDPKTILAKDDEESLKLYALCSGIIDIKDNVISIKNSLDIQKVSFKSTGDLQGKETAAATLNIGSNSVWQDAVGQGVTVEAKEINIAGNVGPNATLKGDCITVRGRTHESSSIYSDHAQINIHAGSSHANSQKVNLLERGKLQGKSVEIKEMFAGSVFADDVIIHTMHNHCKVTASNHVLIHEIVGEDNLITVSNEHMMKNSLHQENQRLKIEQLLNRTVKEHRHKTQLLTNQTPLIQETIIMLKDYKKRGVTMPFTLVNRIKEFKALESEVHSLDKLILEYSNTLELLNETLMASQKSLIKGQVVIGKVEKNNTAIEFHLGTMQANLRTLVQPYTSYALVKNSHEVFEIQTSSYGALLG